MKTLSKKLFIVPMALALACVLSICAACSSSNSSSTSSTESDTYTLTVGFDSGYPPYGFLSDDGKTYTGFDLDLAQLVCEKNGWEMVENPIDWDAKDADLAAGTINCIWNGFTYEGREDKYTFSDPYMRNEQVIVVKADSGITSEADLAGKVVITQAGSAAYDVLTGDSQSLSDTFASLSTIDNYNSAFMQLESGLCDAVACDLSIANYQIAAKPGVFSQIAVLSSETYAVGFKLGDTEHAEAVSKALKELDDEGKIEELCEKYSEYGISYANWIL